MADKNIGAVIVGSDRKVEGIFSERDYARKVILLGKTSRETLVKEIMTTSVVSIDPDWTADQCMALMTDKRIRHLPVIEHESTGRSHLDRRRRPGRGPRPTVHDQVARAVKTSRPDPAPAVETRASLWSFFRLIDQVSDQRPGARANRNGDRRHTP
jgi:CBS-domain-containing membrane protein